MSTSVEVIAASLVREFLSRKGLKQTLAKMDEELPRSPESISNRAGLAEALNIEKLMKKNKERGSPLQTMIEVIAKYLVDKSGTTSATKISHNSYAASTDYMGQYNSGENPSVRVGNDSKRATLAAGTTNHRPISENPRLVSQGDPSREPVTKPVSVTSSSRSTGRGLESRECGFKPRSINEWESDQQRCPSGTPEVKTDVARDEPTTHYEGTKTQPTTSAVKKLQSKPGTRPKTSALGDLLYEDLEDLDLGTGDRGMGYSGSRLTAGNPPPPQTIIGSPISLETARDLRELIFGSASAPSFNSEWRRQDFSFCELPGLEYGLVQHKGGPCGVMACIQAYLLRHLLFSEGADHMRSSSLTHCSPERRNAALVSALAEILWRCGQQSGTAIVALPPSVHHSRPSSTLLPSRSYIPDHITERIVLYSFSDSTTLEDFVSSHVFIFQEQSKSGCIHFILSAILSKGIDSIRREMDDGGGPLIAAHSYCSQELVNLLLTGNAVSNVFDGNLTLESGATQKSFLRGIPDQSQIGFLSLFEYYGNCIVGIHYKEPVFPIWVVCSESHFTVLFSHQRNLLSNWELENKFDLFYYDGLANQDEEIRLTIDTSMFKVGEMKLPQTKTNRDLESPLQLCIQTKWRNATVDWNGTEPLL